MHAVVKRYRVRLGTMQQAARYAEKWFLPLLRQISGFKSCYLFEAGENVLASVAFYENGEAAARAGDVAEQWFRTEWTAYRPLPPEAIGGEVLVEAFSERRIVADRRRSDRRTAAALAFPQASGRDLRSGTDRRSGVDRRAAVVPLIELRAAG